MAKRKRLSPATALQPSAEAAPETKSLTNGWAGVRGAPIADVAGASATQAALEEVAGEMADARRDGRLVQRIALDMIDETYLVRDRAVVDPDEMTALEQSIKARGQQTPLEVVALGGDRFGLISGWRRLMALRTLAKSAGLRSDHTALCLVRAPQSASEAYLAMVEENEIRAPLSYYERARIAARAAEQGAYPTPRHAVKGLFASVSASKRSKITSFLSVYDALDDVLAFPASLSERMGLTLAKALEADAGLAPRIMDRLAESPAADASTEQQALVSLLEPDMPPSIPPAPAEPDTRMAVPQEALRVTRSKGKLVLSGPSVTPELMDALETWLKEWM